MVKNIKLINIICSLLVIAGLVGVAYEAYQTHTIGKVNNAISQGKTIEGDAYPYLKKFMAGYQQGNTKDYKHAVQTYGQLLETKPSLPAQAKLHFNTANNLFTLGLIRRVNDDGSLQDDARYAYMQAKMAYEQSLRSEPSNKTAKYNLSLLQSVIANNMKPAPKDQDTMELSNLPIGLP